MDGQIVLVVFVDRSGRVGVSFRVGWGRLGWGGGRIGLVIAWDVLKVMLEIVSLLCYEMSRVDVVENVYCMVVICYRGVRTIEGDGGVDTERSIGERLQGRS